MDGVNSVGARVVVRRRGRTGGAHGEVTEYELLPKNDHVVALLNRIRRRLHLHGPPLAAIG